MNYAVRLTEEAQANLLRLYDFLLEQGPDMLPVAESALESITQAFSFLQGFPFSCRKPSPHHPYVRELIIPFGSSGYVALFEIEPEGFVTILAVRHQRESDYR